MRIKIFLVLSCASFVVCAQDKSTNVITPRLVNELAEEARTNNSSLWASRARVAAAELNARSIKIWQDPQVMAGGMAAERMMREEDGDVMYGVEQALPVFGKEKAAREAARKEVQVEESALEERFQKLRRDLAEALFKAALEDELLEIAREDVSWLELLRETVEQRYASGTSSQVELMRARNEHSRIGELVRNRENFREDAYATVNRFLNRNVNSAWARLELPDIARPLPSHYLLTELALKFEPELARMRKERDRAAAMSNAVRKERLPDVMAAVEGRQYSRTGDGRSVSVLFKVSIPLFNRDKYKAAIDREAARVQEIDSTIEDAIYAVAAEIHHVVTREDNARREALLYEREIIPRTEVALQSAEAGWRAGREGLREVIELRRMLVEARTMRARAIAEQYIAQYDLILCCGLADIEALEQLRGREQP